MIYLIICLGILRGAGPEFPIKNLVRMEDAFQVAAVAADSDHIVVLSRQAPYLRLLDADLTDLAAWGARGRGPGEFSYPVTVCLSNQEVWVLNKHPNLIHLFSLQGDYLKTKVLKDADHASNMKISKGWVVVQDGSLDRTPNKLLEVSKPAPRFLEVLDMGEVLVLKPGSGPPLSVGAPYASRDLWDLIEPGLLLTYTPASGMTLRDTQLRVLETWQLPKRTFPITDEARTLWLDRNFSGSSRFPVLSWRKEAVKIAMPSTFAQVLQLRGDQDRIWILRAYQPQGQLWECYQNQQFQGWARLPISAEVHLIHQDRVFWSDPMEDVPLTLSLLIRDE